MKRTLEPEIMLDALKCKEYNNVSHRQYKNNQYLNYYEKYCGLTKGTLIDLGSGPGVHLEYMRLRFPDLKIIGYESSDAMIALANENTSVEIQKGNIYDINDTSDGVLCMYTLHHLHDPIKFWKTVSRISKGYVYIEDFERPMTDIMFDKFNAIDDFKHSLKASFTLNEIKSQLICVGLNYNVIRKPIDFEKELYKLIIYQKI